jgi:lipopolysaccharide export system protein LptA
VKPLVAVGVLSFFSLALAIPASGDTFRFQARKMSGSRASGKDLTVLEGAAQVVSDSLVLKADRIELSGEKNRFVDCFGAVSGVDEDKGVFFRTQRLRYDRTAKVARLEGDSILEDKKNAVIAKGRFIEYNDANGTTVLQIGVRLFKNDLVCRSEWALYRREEQDLELAGMPSIFKDGDEFRAYRMRVDLKTDDITMEGSVSGSIKEIKKDAP